MLTRLRRFFCKIHRGHDWFAIDYYMGVYETWRCADCGAIQHEGRRVA